MILTYAFYLDDLLKKAEESPRKRAIFSPHNEKDPVNFFYNALMPDAYVQPHKHHKKDEYFEIVRGEILVVTFNDNGHVLHVAKLSEKNCISCRIQPGEWHSVIALEKSVILEVKLGPYDPATAKTFAPWAPSEAEFVSGPYLKQLRQIAKSYFA